MTQPPRKAPGLLTASLRVFEISLGEMLWSRRTIFMGLVVGLPVLMAMVIRLFNLAGASGVRVNNLAVDGPAIFGLMIWAFFVKFSVPVLGVFYGTSLVADEVEDKTITYLFTRPIAREAVMIGKYLAYVACTVFVVLPAIVLVWILVIPMGGSLGGNFLDLVKDLGIVALGLAVYGAVFALIGAYFKRPLLIGLVFIFGWEQTVVALPTGSFKLFSVAHYLQGLVPHAMPNDSFASMMTALFRDPPTMATSLVVLPVILVVFLGLAAFVAARREYVLEQ